MKRFVILSNSLALSFLFPSVLFPSAVLSQSPVTPPEPAYQAPKNCAQAAASIHPASSLPLAEQEKRLRDVLKVCPEMAEAHANLASLLLKRKSFVEARQNFEKAFVIHEDAAFVVGLGNVAFASGDSKEAESQYERALGIDPNSSQALQGLAAIELSSEDFPQAEEYLRKAAQLTPEDPVLFYNFGVVLSRQGKVDESIKSFRAAIERKPDYVSAREQLVKLLLRQSKFDEAEQLLRAALDQDNSDVLSAVMLASVLDARGQTKPAEKVLNTFEKKFPERAKQDASVRLSRAVLRIKKGKIVDGISQLQDLEKTLDFEKNKGKVDGITPARLYGALGWAYLQEGEILKAIEFLNRALRENPDDQISKMNLEVANSIAGPSSAVVAPSRP